MSAPEGYGEDWIGNQTFIGDDGEPHLIAELIWLPVGFGADPFEFVRTGRWFKTPRETFVDWYSGARVYIDDERTAKAADALLTRDPWSWIEQAFAVDLVAQVYRAFLEKEEKPQGEKPCNHSQPVQ